MSSLIRLWSVGHSNHSIEKFLQILELGAIKCVVDVRSQPYSKYTPHFNSAPLKSSLSNAEIEYVFMGDSLGGRPPEPFMYDDDGHVLYGEMAKSTRLCEGIEKLLDLASNQRTVMMCSEESPVNCHRRLLIARVLSEGTEVVHLRSDGSQISEIDFTAIVEPPEPLTLFAIEEVQQWRSILPVLRNTAQDNSSGH